MPQGKGTYGKQVGRPPTKQKKHSATDAIKEVDTKSTGYSTQDKAKRKTQKEIYKAKLSGNYMDLRGDKGKKSMKDDVTGTAVSKPYKMHSPLEYTPFKMKAADYGNSPMRKNFGIGDSEMPIEMQSPGKSASPAKGWLKNLGRGIKKAAGFTPVGLMAKGLFGKRNQPGAEAGAEAEAPVDPMAQAAQAAQGTAMEQETAEGGGGEVPPHGPEAHTGGGGPIGGMQKKRPFGPRALQPGGGVARFF